MRDCYNVEPLSEKFMLHTLHAMIGIYSELCQPQSAQHVDNNTLRFRYLAFYTQCITTRLYVVSVGDICPKVAR